MWMVAGSARRVGAAVLAAVAATLSASPPVA
jgi:hypothetical protein